MGPSFNTFYSEATYVGLGYSTFEFAMAIFTDSGMVNLLEEGGSITVGEPVYASVWMENPYDGLVLFVTDCYATPSLESDTVYPLFGEQYVLSIVKKKYLQRVYRENVSEFLGTI